MTAFRIEGYGADGRRAALVLDAADAAAARRAAAATGLTPLRIRATEGPEAAAGLPRPVLLALLTELSALLSARVPLAEALSGIRAQARARRGRAARQGEAAERLLAALRAGRPLSAALADPGIGAPAAVTGTVLAGERQGDLAAALGRAAATLARAARLSSRIRAALTYPAILLAVTLLSVGGILLGVVPALKPVLAAAGDRAPASARFLIAASDGLAAGWMPGLAGLLAVALAGVRAARAPAVQAARDRLILRLPMIGAGLRAGETAMALRITADLLAAGAPLPEALRLAAGAARLAPVAAALDRIAARVREGGDFPALWSSEPALAPAAAGLVAAGARAGRLHPMMVAAAEALEREAEAATDRVLALLPPVMTLILGLVVGTVSLTIIGAIMSVNDAAL